MTVDGQFECFTLERQEVAIPAGTYPVELRTGPVIKRLIPHLDNVPGRQGIDIHSGNKPADSEGCILVGTKRTSDGKGLQFPAHPALDSLILKIQAATARKEKIDIRITE